MTWLIVVAGLVAVALGVHFAEERRAKTIIAKRRVQRAAVLGDLHRFSHARQVQEVWSADLRAMTLSVTRSAQSERDVVTNFRLERSTDGAWQMQADSTSSEAVPQAVAEKLEQQHQQFARKPA